MGFPEGAQTTVLTMKLGLTDGSADRETVTITPSPSQIISTALNDIREGTAVTVTPDRSSGSAQVRLLNTDASGYNPTGWTYSVQRGSRAPYSISLPASLGTTADLADLTEVSESPGVYDVLLPASELGTAAFLDVGQTTGTVAAGDDGRFSSGGGGGTPSSTVVAGTSFGGSSTAGVATAYSRGDHSHGTPATPTKSTVGLGNVDNTSDAGKPISTATATALATKADLSGGLVPLAQLPTPSAQGALTKTSNLSDVASAATARSNLGLGTAAVAAASSFDAAGAAGAVSSSLTTHTGATTSVHGITDTSALVTTADSRLTNSRTPTGAAGGDLSGTFPNPTVAAIGGVVVSGTAANGKVITATGASAASWQTPTGGGGGTSIRTASVRITDDNLAGLPSAAAWVVAVTSASTPLQVTIAATAGDRIRVCGNFMRAGSHFLDWVLLNSGGSIGLYASTGTSTPGTEGNPSMYPSLSFSYVAGDDMFTVGSGHINAGNVTIALAHQGTGSGLVYAHPTYPWRLRLENIGPEPS